MNAAQAWEGRRNRAEVISELRCSSPQRWAESILTPPAALEGVFVFDLLRALPGIGAVRIKKVNRAAIQNNINLAVSLGDLRGPSREWLAQCVETIAPGGRKNYPERKGPN